VLLKYLILAGVLVAAGCSVEGQRTEPVQETVAMTPPVASAPVREVKIRQGTVCARLVAKVREIAERHPQDVPAFLAALQREFVGGSGDPFAMRQALREKRWNPRYVYAGHGGFRPEYDDDRKAYREGGNHQPGHFISVFSIAAQFGGDAARLAIGEAGDYNPEEEDDLRLSGVAIRLGTGLAGGSLSAADVAVQVRKLCR
jgi:hypothetical protein